MYFGIAKATHCRLFQYELGGLNSPEQKIEDLEDERVPAVERGVAGRAGGDGEKEIKETGFGKSANESALQRRELRLIGAEVHIRREVFDKSQIPDEMEDDVHDLHVALRSRLGATGEAGQRDAEQCLEDARSEQGSLVVQVALHELRVVRTAIELLVQLLELLRQVDGPRHRGDEVGARDGPFVFDVALSGRLEDDGDEVVREDARCPQNARDGTLVVGVVLPPELLQIFQASVRLVSETIYPSFVTAQRIDDVDYRRFEYSPSLRMVALLLVARGY